MATPISPATFFQSPRLLEERKPYYNALYSQAARATAFSGWVGGDAEDRRARPMGRHPRPPTGPTLQQQAAAIFPGNYAAQMTWMAAQGSVNGLAGLGDWFSDAVKTLHTGAMDALDTVTGKKEREEAQRQAAVLAAQRQQSTLEQAQIRAEAWVKNAPWLAIGGTVLGIGVLYVVLKKRGG